MESVNKPPQKKSSLFKQIGIGTILGLLTIFIPLFPVVYLLQMILQPQTSFIPAVIITVLLNIITTLLTRKKYPAFAYPYLTFSLLALAVITYFFQSFTFT